MNKASGGDGIPVELFQILKDDAIKVLHSICQKIWKTAVATGLEKVSFYSSPKERKPLNMYNYIVCFSININYHWYKVNMHSSTKSIMLVVISSGFDFLIQCPELFDPSCFSYSKM